MTQPLTVSEIKQKITAAEDIIQRQTEQRDAAKTAEDYVAYDGDVMRWQTILTNLRAEASRAVIRIDTADVAKLIRKDLKRVFPTIKFSVRTSRYAGGSSIDVYWTDGPTTKQVDRLIKHYAGSSFDGMIDLKSYHDEEQPDGAVVHYGADHVFATRSYSAGFLRSIALEVAADWGMTPPAIVERDSSEPYVERDNRYPPTGNGIWTISDLVQQAAYATPDLAFVEDDEAADD